MDISEYCLYLVTHEVKSVEARETEYIVTLRSGVSFCIDKIYRIELFQGDTITLYINVNKINGIEKEEKLLFFDPQSHIEWAGPVKTENFLEIEKSIITKVETTSDSDSFIIRGEYQFFFLEKKFQYRPHVGDEMTLYINGCVIYGVIINGKQIFFITKGEYKKQKEEEKIADEERARLEYENNREQREKDYSELPEVFRIFIARNKASLTPEEIISWEEFLLFCCKEAVKITEAIKDPKKVIKFNKLSAEKQYRMVPNMDKGHSGTTFSTSVKLAYHYLKNDILNTENNPTPQKKKKFSLRFF